MILSGFKKQVKETILHNYLLTKVLFTFLLQRIKFNFQQFYFAFN